MRVSSRARSGPLCQRGLCFSTRDHDRDNIMLWVLLAVNERQKGQALPLLPNGKQIRVLTRDWSTAGTGGTVWTSAQALCRWLSLSQEAVEGRTILELGSGTGAAGLHAAGLGARSVHLTDGGPPLLLSLLKHNVARNQHKFPVAAAATVRSSAVEFISPDDQAFGCSVASKMDPSEYFASMAIDQRSRGCHAYRSLHARH